MESVQLELDQHPVRFTPDGKIAVIDAIKALSDRPNSERIWRRLSRSHPEIVLLCDTYHFKSTEPTPVANLQGWEAIQGHLFNYIVEEDMAQTR